MTARLSRRDFLKLSALALGSLAFKGSHATQYNPFPLPTDDRQYPTGIIGRVAFSYRISLYNEPDWHSPVIGYLNRKDELINIYYEVISEDGPAYNPLWYRVWGGYIHSAYVQRVRFRFNAVLPAIREAGQLCEVTVPYTIVYRYNAYKGWERFFRLYYETTHWVTGIAPGPDGRAWYKINDAGIEYMVPAEHLRPVPDEEMTPISPDVAWEDKRIEVSIARQTLRAYENENLVFQTQVSTGQNLRPDPNDIPWDTPRGTFYVSEKTPSTHMGQGNLTGDPEAYELPGVPWTTYFVPDIGVAFHGAYWHNNFGMQMSHGCVNMRPAEARWLFRWTYPIFKVPIENKAGWLKRGRGTRVDVI